MKLLSWNINGLRAVLKGNFTNVIELESPDVVCLQEIRIQEKQLPNEFLNFCERNNYSYFANYGKRPGYAGTMTLVKDNCIEPRYSFSKEVSPRYDEYEGRTVIINYDGIKIINTYVMNSKNDASRKDERVDFNSQILDELCETKRTILCGDLNAIAEDLDIYKPDLVIAGNYTFERQFIKDVKDIGYFDSFRLLHQDEQQYSWFSRFPGAEENNRGLRLDYFMLRNDMRYLVKRSDILQSHASDHKPIVLEVLT